MRVIAGTARSLPLKTVPGASTRPTTDKIKETLFNILAPQIPGAVFLDLFSGSGGIGIEALSRGASKCVFVENDAKAAACIADNLRFTKLEENAVIMRKNVLSAINELALRGLSFDIVYVDPPYFEGLEEETLRSLASSGLLNEDSLVIIEASKENPLDFIETLGFRLTREKQYKTNKHCFLRVK